jgi:hypothetical protein
MVDRARRYARDIVLAVILTVAALLFLGAALLSEHPSDSSAGGAPAGVHETGSVGAAAKDVQ